MAVPRRSRTHVLTPAGFSVLAVIVFVSALAVAWVMLSSTHRGPAAPSVQSQR
jgi:hypothetical protein